MKIPAPHGHLEANLREPDDGVRGAAVVCHPHPLHGGTMHTKAVFRAAQALAEAGLLALRFNFRGVGTSTGSFDEGVGEQDDVRAALEWLAGEAPEVPMVVAGFSFGSLVGLRVGVEEDRVRALLGMGLPVSMYDYSFLGDTEKPTLVVQGEEDEFGGGEEVEDALAGLGGHVTVVRVPGADHYFDDRFEPLKEAIGEYFTSGAGSRVLTARTPGRT